MNENIQGSQDKIATYLKKYAENSIIVIAGLLPILFLPIVAAPFEYTKVMFVIVGLAIACILYSLSVLRSGTLVLSRPLPLVALLGVALVTLVSAVLSGDLRDALMGDFFSTHGAVFVVILALLPTILMFIRVEKQTILRLYMLLALSTLVLVGFHLLRIFFGAESFSLGVFPQNTASPIGSWNDLSLFFGLTIIIALIALEQLSLSRLGKILFIGVTIASLVILSVINFVLVWFVLGILSLVVIVYSVGRDRFNGGQLSLSGIRTQNSTSLLVSLIVFTVSVVFIVGGSTIGAFIAKQTGIPYIEVRPSFEATAGIARNVYAENPVLGIGPNKFADAWRMHRDASINQTLFWNTDFVAGNGYITTFFVTTGILGGVMWCLFLLTYIVYGLRRLLRAVSPDRLWYFIGLSSFVSATYLWVMAVLYVPGAVLLILASLCTGISCIALETLSGTNPRVVNIGLDRRMGFVLTLVVIFVVILSVATLYGVGRHYSSVYTFNQSLLGLEPGASIDELERKVERAYMLSRNDVFAREIGRYQLARMSEIITRPDLAEADYQEFNRAKDIGIEAAKRAISIDPEEPANWALLGDMYGILATINVEGAADEALAAISRSRDLNPRNPLPYLTLAVIDARMGNVDRSRANIEESIRLKPNFTEAYYLLSQLEIATGNVGRAIESTRAMITLDSQNSARYYQLGVLLVSERDVANAIPAFEKAIEINQDFANARYLLALAYDEVGRSGDAKAQLEAVQRLNPDNTEVANLITVITNEGSLARLRGQVQSTISETTLKTEEDGTVSTSGNPEPGLIEAVNAVPKADTQE